MRCVTPCWPWASQYELLLRQYFTGYPFVFLYRVFRSSVKSSSQFELLISSHRYEGVFSTPTSLFSFLETKSLGRECGGAAAGRSKPRSLPGRPEAARGRFAATVVVFWGLCRGALAVPDVVLEALAGQAGQAGPEGL